MHLVNPSWCVCKEYSLTVASFGLPAERLNDRAQASTTVLDASVSQRAVTLWQLIIIGLGGTVINRYIFAIHFVVKMFHRIIEDSGELYMMAKQASFIMSPVSNRRRWSNSRSSTLNQGKHCRASFLRILAYSYVDSFGCCSRFMNSAMSRTEGRMTGRFSPTALKGLIIAHSSANRCQEQ